MKLTGKYQFRVYADDVNILGGSLHTVRETAEALIVASKEIGLEVNADKTKSMVMSRDQNAERSHNMKIDNRSFETTIYRAFHNVLHEYKYLLQENQKNCLNGIVHSHGKTENFFFYNYRCSMCAPRVTRHTSIRYSSCCHTRINMLTRVWQEL